MTGTETNQIPETLAGSVRVYFQAMLGALCATLAVLGGSLWTLHNQGALSPLPLSPGISFNEKALFVREALHTKYDMIAAGSSMTLNNLVPDVVTEAIPGHPRILDIAAWGMKISDTRLWLRGVVKRANPKSVIVVEGMMDFYTQPKWLDMTDAEIDTFLARDSSSRALEFLEYFSLQYYLKNGTAIRIMRSTRSDYASLRFDRNGAVPLDLRFPHVDSYRWNDLPTPGLLSEVQYEQLSLLAQDMTRRGIRLVLVQAPLRSHALVEGRDGLARHWQRLETIMKLNGQTFIDLHAMGFDDSYFADYAHLNTKGASAFSKELGFRMAAAPAAEALPLPLKRTGNSITGAGGQPLTQ